MRIAKDGTVHKRKKAILTAEQSKEVTDPATGKIDWKKYRALEKRVGVQHTHPGRLGYVKPPKRGRPRKLRRENSAEYKRIRAQTEKK